jgi:prevent-host-death family protein
MIMNEKPVAPAPEVAVRDLRNRGGEILDRVAQGESLTVTRDGRPIAELRPLARRPLPAALLLERWRRVPPVDPVRLRGDIDSVLDSSL